MRSSGCSGHTKQGVVGPVPREDAVKMLRVAVVVVIVVAVAVVAVPWLYAECQCLVL